MPVSTLDTLSVARWQLVNLLYRRPNNPNGWNVHSAVKLVAADLDDVAELADADMLILARNDDIITTTAAKAAHWDNVRVAIGDAGLAWATRNPANRVLLTLAEHKDDNQGTAPYQRILIIADVPPSVFHELHAGGLVELQWAESGRRASVAEVKMAPTKFIRVKMTLNGWRRLAV